VQHTLWRETEPMTPLRRLITTIVVVVVLVFQYNRAMGPNVDPRIAGVVAVMAASLAWTALLAVFRLIDHCKKQ